MRAWTLAWTPPLALAERVSATAVLRCQQSSPKQTMTYTCRRSDFGFKHPVATNTATRRFTHLSTAPAYRATNATIPGDTLPTTAAHHSCTCSNRGEADLTPPNRTCLRSGLEWLNAIKRPDEHTGCHLHTPRPHHHPTPWPLLLLVLPGQRRRPAKAHELEHQTTIHIITTPSMLSLPKHTRPRDAQVHRARLPKRCTLPTACIQ